MTKTNSDPSPDQLTLLPDAADVPIRFRLDAATRQRGLRHIAEIRARLDRAGPATRAPAPPGGHRPDRAA